MYYIDYTFFFSFFKIQTSEVILHLQRSDIFTGGFCLYDLPEKIRLNIHWGYTLVQILDNSVLDIHCRIDKVYFPESLYAHLHSFP